MRFRKPPIPPTDVRIVYLDGTSRGVEVKYNGKYKGQHIWLITEPASMLSDNPPVGIHIGELPGRSSVELELR